MVKRGGGEIFSKFRGELAKRGVKKLRGIWTLDEAMCLMLFMVSEFILPSFLSLCGILYSLSWTGVVWS